MNFAKIRKAWIESQKSEKEKKAEEKFLIENGWHTWYNEDYWVHPKVISDPTRQDYTNYGMPRSDAIIFEKEKGKPIQGSLFGFINLKDDGV